MSRAYPTPPQTGGVLSLSFDTSDGTYEWITASGSSSHAALSSLAWTSSGHTGTANRIAAFSGAGAATYLQVGVDVQAYDADLDTLAGLSKTDGNFIVADGASWTVESGATARTSLGLGSLATQSTINNGDWSGTDLAVVNGGTGSSTASGARTNLGLGSLATASTISDSDWSGTDLAIANGGTGQSTATAALDALGVRRVRKASDQTLIGTAYTDISTLSFSVVSGKTYYFEFYILADAGATTTGIDVAVNGPTTTVLSYIQLYWTGATTYSERNATTYDNNTGSGTSNGATTRMFSVRGIITPSADGTLAARIKREAVGTGPNVRAGSIGIITAID